MKLKAIITEILIDPTYTLCQKKRFIFFCESFFPELFPLTSLSYFPFRSLWLLVCSGPTPLDTLNWLLYEHNFDPAEINPMGYTCLHKVLSQDLCTEHNLEQFKYLVRKLNKVQLQRVLESRN